MKVEYRDDSGSISMHTVLGAVDHSAGSTKGAVIAPVLAQNLTGKAEQPGAGSIQYMMDGIKSKRVSQHAALRQGHFRVPHHQHAVLIMPMLEAHDDVIHHQGALLELQ